MKMQACTHLSQSHRVLQVRVRNLSPLARCVCNLKLRTTCKSADPPHPPLPAPYIYIYIRHMCIYYNICICILYVLYTLFSIT